jgi:uncharacterized protein with HEPN domain
MSNAIDRVSVIYKKICFIENIVAKNGGIIKALEDEENSRAAMLMHLTAIAEQFDKLLKNGEFEILSLFNKKDLKGTYDVRNYIAHDYEGINLSVIENVLRNKLPSIKKIIEDKILHLDSEGDEI